MQNQGLCWLCICSCPVQIWVKEVVLVLALLELIFQLRRWTNACEIKREIYLVIDI